MRVDPNMFVANSEDLSYRVAKIPKKGKGFRKIYIPSKNLKKKLRGYLKDYEKHLDSLLGEELNDTMHGFRSRKNCCTAAHQHIGFDCTVILDIQEFFDNCSKEAVREQFKGASNLCFSPEGFLAQGFPTSPVLANMCLVPALKELKMLFTPLLGNYALTVFADDIQVSFNLGTQEMFYLENTVKQIVKTVMNKYSFTVKDSKTRVRYAKHGFRRILGVNCGDDKLYPSRKTNRKIRAAKHQCNHQSLGGLVTWSKCLLPRTKEEHFQFIKNLKQKGKTK